MDLKKNQLKALDFRNSINFTTFIKFDIFNLKKSKFCGKSELLFRRNAIKLFGKSRPRYWKIKDLLNTGNIT